MTRWYHVYIKYLWAVVVILFRHVAKNALLFWLYRVKIYSE